MAYWREQLRVDPIPALVSSQNQALLYFVRRDLLEEEAGPAEALWELVEVQRILRKQQADGAWKYPGGKHDLRAQEDYNQLETFRILGLLVEKYGFHRGHPAIQKATEFLFAHRTAEGDFRGIYGAQYATTYHPAIMELLIKAGYGGDPRIEPGFAWLLAMRQDDGGWAVPLRTVGMGYVEALRRPQPIQPDGSRPFSHLVTGMVLRAFAAHPRYRNSGAALRAGALLLSRLFQPDKYVDRREASYWERVSFPFWFTDIVSALDSLSWLGFTRENAQIQRALDWLKERQRPNGLFALKLLRGKDPDLALWVCLAVCRVFKRQYG